MEIFDFDAPAEMYACRAGRRGRNAVTYRRFQSGAEAIKYAVEQQSRELLRGTVIESEDVRLESTQIQALYLSASYPLSRADIG